MHDAAGAGALVSRPVTLAAIQCALGGSLEENVDRVVEAVGIKPIVFGSDFPHGEGLPEPELYLGQLKNLNDDDTRLVMRDNLARFLDLA